MDIISRPLVDDERSALRRLSADLSREAAQIDPDSYLFVEMVSCAEQIDTFLLASSIKNAPKAIGRVIQAANRLLDRATEAPKRISDFFSQGDTSPGQDTGTYVDSYIVGVAS